MKNLKVSWKIYSFIVVMAIIAAIIGGLGAVGMFSIQNGFTELANRDLAASIAMGEIIESFQKERVYLANMLVYIDDPGAINEQIANLNAAHIIGDAAVQKYLEAMDMSPGAAFIEVGELLNPPDGRYYLLKAEIMQAAIEGDSRKIHDSLELAAGYIETIENNLRVTMNQHISSGNERVSQNGSLFQTLLILQIVIMMSGLIGAILVGRYIVGLISKPLIVLRGYMEDAGNKGILEMTPEEKRMIPKYSQHKDEIGDTIKVSQKFIEHITHISEELEKISNGDLTVNINVLSDEDIMGNTLLRLEQNLNNMFGELNASTSQVSAGAKQIADGSQSLAQGSTEQAASVQQLSSSIAEIAAKTKENADMAERAAILAGTIMSSAEKGSRQMDEMITAVNDINQASQQISKVIKVIDDIAFQTNILALNAAVEAARAGQHGKGFAVVAEEVRSLAAKSADAAKETGEMIQNSMEKAGLGSRIAGETAESLTGIVQGINESTQLVSQIAQSSGEQTAGIVQINDGIDQVAQIIQQTSATAEESAAASEEMSEQSDMLQSLVDQFKLKDSGHRELTSAVSSRTPQKRPDIPQKTNYSASDGGDYGKY